MQKLVVRPLTEHNWDDFEVLFGRRGACGGCWCMWWRLARSEFNLSKGEGNREKMKRLVASGEIPGVLGYVEGRPCAWCSVAPREKFPVLERSRILKSVDDRPVWSIVCFFIARPFRRKGLSVELLKNVSGYCRSRGASIIEGYPVEPKKAVVSDVFIWTGVASAFQKAGFVEVTRRSPTRPIMRLVISKY